MYYFEYKKGLNEEGLEGVARLLQELIEKYADKIDLGVLEIPSKLNVDKDNKSAD